jgi:hypothetical protein
MDLLPGVRGVSSGTEAQDAMCGCAWRITGSSRATMVGVAWLSTRQWLVHGWAGAGHGRITCTGIARVDDCDGTAKLKL